MNTDVAKICASILFLTLIAVFTCAMVGVFYLIAILLPDNLFGIDWAANYTLGLVAIPCVVFSANYSARIMSKIEIKNK